MKFLLTALLTLASISSFASESAKNDPVLYFRDAKGSITRTFDLQDAAKLKDATEYAVYNPFDLENACYTGDVKVLIEKILLHDDFLDHAGDYSCYTEAELSKDERVIQYKCTDGESDARKFMIVPCSAGF